MRNERQDKTRRHVQEAFIAVMQVVVDMRGEGMPPLTAGGHAAPYLWAMGALAMLNWSGEREDEAMLCTDEMMFLTALADYYATARERPSAEGLLRYARRFDDDWRPGFEGEAALIRRCQAGGKGDAS